MSDISDRYQRIAGGFTARVVGSARSTRGTGPRRARAGWARDVVGHLVEWIPAFFFATWDIEAGELPSATEDPVGAWMAFDRTVQAALDDPEVSGRERDTHMGRGRFDATFDMIATSDVFLHTWDLARATGLDEDLDPEEVHGLLVGMEPMDAVLRESGHFGPRVAVPVDADEQTRLLAFIGRQP